MQSNGIKDALTAIFTYHERYSLILTKFAFETVSDLNSVILPSVEFTPRGGRIAGRFMLNKHVCIYSIPYILLLGEKYEDIVAHECCHAFQREVKQWQKFSWHGEFFHFLLQDVCKRRTAKAKHSYNAKATRIIQKMVALNRETFRSQINTVKKEHTSMKIGVHRIITRSDWIVRKMS